MKHLLNRKELAAKIAEYAAEKIKQQPHRPPADIIVEALNQYTEDLESYCELVEATNHAMFEAQKSFKQLLLDRKQ